MTSAVGAKQCCSKAELGLRSAKLFVSTDRKREGFWCVDKSGIGSTVQNSYDRSQGMCIMMHAVPLRICLE